MAYLWNVFLTVPPSAAALIVGLLATTGWLYSARRARELSRKQHTFNALLQLSANEQYHKHLDILQPLFRQKKMPNFSVPTDDPAVLKVRDSLRFILNHYEFLSAGIRNGDISERLLRDSERGPILIIFDVSRQYIAAQRDALRNNTFEHIEWLYVRWEAKPPTRWQCFVEWVIARPLYHDRHKWIAFSVLMTFLLIIAVGYLHLPGEPFNPQAAVVDHAPKAQLIVTKH